MRHHLHDIWLAIEALNQPDLFTEDERNSCLEHLEVVESGLNVLKDAMRREQRLTTPKHYIK